MSVLSTDLPSLTFLCTTQQSACTHSFASAGNLPGAPTSPRPRPPPLLPSVIMGLMDLNLPPSLVLALVDRI
jgi:hypothetical protein